MKKTLAAIFWFCICATARADTLGQGIVRLENPYTCVTASQIKFQRKRYDRLSFENRVFIDGKYNECEYNKRVEAAKKTHTALPSAKPVYFINPTPTKDSSRIFYGTVRREDLENAEINCGTAGRVGGVALTITGAVSGNPFAGQAGSIVYKYSDISCASLANAVKENNLMVVIAPGVIVLSAVRGEIAKSVIDKLPLVSDADKENLKDFSKTVTTPPTVIVGEQNDVEIKGNGYRIPVSNPFKGWRL